MEEALRAATNKDGMSEVDKPGDCMNARAIGEEKGGTRSELMRPDEISRS